MMIMMFNRRHRANSHVSGCETENQLDMHRRQNHRYMLRLLYYVNGEVYGDFLIFLQFKNIILDIPWKCYCLFV